MVEKLGFREEAYHARYLHIDGAWRDHVGYALTTEDVVAEGGLLARWHRLRGRGSRQPRTGRNLCCTRRSSLRGRFCGAS